jgi:hypothetical protein
MYETTTLTDAGAYYTADTVLSLRGGDTDNDSDVDINDVTWFVFTFGDLAADGGCPWDGTTRDADFSNNGAVGSEDYSFLTANWLDFTNCSCTLASSPAPGRKPHGMGVTAIDTQLLQPEVAEMVDANRDGRFDHQDVRIFEERHGLPHELSRNLKMLDQSLDDAADVNESNPGRNQAGRN